MEGRAEGSRGEGMMRHVTEGGGAEFSFLVLFLFILGNGTGTGK